MDAAESTSRTNGTNQEEEERKQKSSTVVGAAATIAAVGVAAWGIFRMLSDNKEKMKMKTIAEPSYAPEGLSQTSGNTWSPPPQGRLKLNTDGTCRPEVDYNNKYGVSVERGPGGYGGILRDHNGDWVRGFIGYIGVTDSLTAELHGILKGLEFLDKPCYKGAIIETDSEPAHIWVSQPDKKCSKRQIVINSWHIIEKCRQLIDKNKIKINKPVPRGANKCADKLAGFAIENKVKYMEIQDLPKEIGHLVTEDARLSKLR